MSIRRKLFELGLTLALTACQQPIDISNATYNPETHKPEISSVQSSPTTLSTSEPTVAPTPVQRTQSPSPTILKTNTPTPQPEPSPTVRQTQSPTRNPIVYVSGMCDGNPRNTFSEITTWLSRDLKYTSSDFYYFNYQAGGLSGDRYDVLETMKSIDGNGGSAENLRNFILKSKTPVDLITHSQGGIVALYALAQYPELKGRIHSIVTINSPVHGIEWEKDVLSQVYPCVDLYEIKNMDLSQIKNIKIDPKKIDINNIKNIDLSQIKDIDLSQVKNRILPPAILDMGVNSSVISRITSVDYRRVFSDGGPYVETLANVGDFFSGTPTYRAGTNGTLSTAYGNSTYLFSLPATFPLLQVLLRHGEFVNPILYSHGIPLEIITMEEVFYKEGVVDEHGKVVDEHNVYFMRDGAMFMESSLRLAINSRK
ncbi:MAG: hypothetical protein HYW22_00625 [Candidatus Aenigmarchaeota archaeon]|nr:hypothetical protein [Candidatus Aenigmarchaeota archaeon]